MVSLLNVPADLPGPAAGAGALPIGRPGPKQARTPCRVSQRSSRTAELSKRGIDALRKPSISSHVGVVSNSPRCSRTTAARHSGAELGRSGCALVTGQAGHSPRSNGGRKQGSKRARSNFNTFLFGRSRFCLASSIILGSSEAPLFSRYLPH